MTTEMIVDLATGETIHRELTAEEIEAARGPLDDQKTARLAALADLRWRKTQTFDYDGETEVPADPALPVITSLAVADSPAPSGAARTFKLKSPAVFREWTVAQIVAYGMAIGVHVQACFDREKALAALIGAAGTQEAFDAIDITTGWPA